MQNPEDKEGNLTTRREVVDGIFGHWILAKKPPHRERRDNRFKQIMKSNKLVDKYFQISSKSSILGEIPNTNKDI